MKLFALPVIALVALFASPVRCEDDKPAGEQFQFQVHTRAFRHTRTPSPASLSEPDCASTKTP